MTTKNTIAKLQLLFWLGLGLCSSAGALTLPGTIIYNSAQLSYEDAQLNQQILTSSNTSSVSVGHQHIFAVENTHQLGVDAGVVARFPHTITNLGNSDDSYLFSFDNLDSDSFSTPQVILDVNGNGVIDVNEPVITSTAVLQMGEEVDVIIVTRVSPALTDGVEKAFTFSIESEEHTQVEQIINTVTVGETSSLDITLDTFPECGVNVFPESIITHVVQVERTGYRPAVDLSYLVDGVPVEGVIFEVPVSEYTQFVGFTQSASLTLPGTKVVKLTGSANNEWTSAAEVTEPQLSQVTSAGYLTAADELLAGRILDFSLEFSVLDVEFSNNKIDTIAFADTDLDRVADQASNSVCNTFGSLGAALPGSLIFVEPNAALRLAGGTPNLFTDGDFVDAEQFTLKRNETDTYNTVRDGVYLELTVEDTNHPDILTDSAGMRYVLSTVTSELTGDTVEVVLLETNTPGVFRSIAPLVLSASIRSDGGVCPILEEGAPVVPIYGTDNPSCVLESIDNDLLRAVFGDIDSGFAVAGVSFVNRQSMLFDTHTLNPIEGAVVQIYIEGGLIASDETTGGSSVNSQVPTGQRAVDVKTGEIYEYVTGSDGRFSLPTLDDVTDYYLHVIPPTRYSFPSQVLPFRITDFNVHGFSYGRKGITLGDDTSGVFSGAEINARKSFDVPLDLSAEGGLLAVDKVAVQKYVDIGQAVSYIVTIQNSSNDDLDDVVVEDTIPFGFRYVSGTTSLEKISVSDPMQSGSGALQFEIGTVAANESVTLTYSLRASAAALDGSGVNTAVAIGYTSSRQVTRSVPGRATVSFQRGGVFSDKASIFGKIYVDQNCDGVQSHKEWPIGGVRLYLQDGTYAVTDGDGQYSLYGLEPGKYVVKVDQYTIPNGLNLKLLSVAQTADGSSRYVDLSEGDLHKVDFASSCPKQDASKVLRELVERNKQVDNGWYLQQAENFNLLKEIQTDNPQSRMSAADGDVSNGLLDGPDLSARDTDGPNSSQTENVTGKTPIADNEVAVKKINIREVVGTITTEQAKAGTWLWPLNGISLNSRFMAVVRAGIEPTLFVNGKPVPSDNIGERLVNKREKAQVIAWYGVELNGGENKVEVRGSDSFGNERVLATGVFKRPMSGSQITLTTQWPTIPADSGRSLLPVTVKILDDNGYPALGVYYITLESNDGSFVEPDIQDSEPGRQIRVENGVRTVHYRPSGTTGEVRLLARTGEFSGEINIHQVAEVRPLVVAGFVEAGAYYGVENFGEFSPSTDLGNLESEGRFDGRAALFIKGTVKEKFNLTLSYDSDKSRDQELLRDINPVLHYPIHGDASIRGFEAQSRSKLYVRVEREKSSIMWGDYLTDPSSDSRDLARISRALTGLNGVLHQGKNTFRLFAANENNQNITEEIPGNGSSLLYRTQQYPIVSNSEIVELVTRSKENPGLILDTVRLSRLGDYTIDDDLGYLAFAASIPTLDGDQNPVYVRITYDVVGDGEEYLVAGARFDRRATEKLTFGASVTVDGHATEGTRLLGLYGDYQLSPRTSLSVSLASSDSEHLGKGRANSISIDHQWQNKVGGYTTLSRVHAGEDFNNLGGAAVAGRTETKVEHTQKLTSSSNARLLLDGNISQSALTTDDRRSIGAVVETKYKAWQVRAGLRQNSHTTVTGKDDFLTALLGLRRKMSILGKSGETNLEYEQDVGMAERRRISVGGKLNLHRDVNTYANYELTNKLLGLSGVTGNSESESFTLGIESKRFKSTRLYSEYRVRGAFESSDQETASGIRGDYAIMEGLRVSPQFEYIRRFGAESDSTSASVGITDTRNPNSRRLLRFETRQSDETDHYGVRASVSTRIDNDWTAMLTDNLSRQEIVGGDTVMQHSFVAALARRPKYNNQHHMLFLYRLTQDDGVTEDLERATHVLSTHQNYQFDPKTLVSGRLGVKQDTSVYSESRVTDLAMLVDARVNHDISRRTSFEAIVGALYTQGSSEVRYSLGLGLNYTINKNLRLSAGYNFVGFEDDGLDTEKYNAEGGRINLQYKLDEELFNWIK